MRRLHPVIAALGACALAACDEPLHPIATEDPAFTVGDGGVLASATGGGVVEFGIPGFGDAHFGFSAAQHADGRATGRFHQFRSAGGLTIEFMGRVTCMSVDPVNHRAWIGGVVTENRSTHPSFQVDTLHAVGLDVWFRVVDYGEGGNAAQPDRSTTFGFKHAAGFITSADYCGGQPWPANDDRTFPVGKGNVQVRP